MPSATGDGMNDYASSGLAVHDGKGKAGDSSDASARGPGPPMARECSDHLDCPLDLQRESGSKARLQRFIPANLIQKFVPSLATEADSGHEVICRESLKTSAAA
jgi:hypothetical protein